MILFQSTASFDSPFYILVKCPELLISPTIMTYSLFWSQAFIFGYLKLLDKKLLSKHLCAAFITMPTITDGSGCNKQTTSSSFVCVCFSCYQLLSNLVQDKVHNHFLHNTSPLLSSRRTGSLYIKEILKSFVCQYGKNWTGIFCFSPSLIALLSSWYIL